MFSDKGDWFDLKLAAIAEHPKFGKQIVANKTISIPHTAALPAGKFTHQAKPKSEFGSRADVAYLVQDNNEIVYDLQKSWLGLMNHAPRNLATMEAFNDAIFPRNNQVIQKGQALTWDYGVHYWVFQICGYEYNDVKRWKKRDLRLFDQMHRRVVDYSDLLNMKLYQCIRKWTVQAIRAYLHHIKRKCISPMQIALRRQKEIQVYLNKLRYQTLLLRAIK
jgi:hypothetical protein